MQCSDIHDKILSLRGTGSRELKELSPQLLACVHHCGFQGHDLKLHPELVKPCTLYTAIQILDVCPSNMHTLNIHTYTPTVCICKLYTTTTAITSATTATSTMTTTYAL